MDKEEIIRRLKKLSGHAVQVAGEPPYFIMSLDDGIALNEAVRLLKEQEEVVRCKDCKYAHLTHSGECKYCDNDADENGFIPVRYRPGDWYCADGERKEGR